MEDKNYGTTPTARAKVNGANPCATESQGREVRHEAESIIPEKSKGLTKLSINFIGRARRVRDGAMDKFWGFCYIDTFGTFREWSYIRYNIAADKMTGNCINSISVKFRDEIKDRGIVWFVGRLMRGVIALHPATGEEYEVVADEIKTSFEVFGDYVGEDGLTEWSR